MMRFLLRIILVVSLIQLSGREIHGVYGGTSPLSSNKCSNEYRVSYDRKAPVYQKYGVDYMVNDNDAKQTCWNWCNEDENCRNVLDVMYQGETPMCVKYNISVHQLMNTWRFDEIENPAAENTPYKSYDRFCAELSGTNCTYPVSHNRTFPHWTLYHIGKMLDSKATDETCHDFCNEDVNCRSVLYVIHADHRRWCAKFNISILELKYTDREEIYTVTDTDKYPTFIIYDRYCDITKEEEMCKPKIMPSIKLGHSRIVGGIPSVTGSWPWMASIQYKADPPIHFCGASIISERTVLTAAHCLTYFQQEKPRYQEKNPKDLMVVVGITTFSENTSSTQYFDVWKFTIHHDYPMRVWYGCKGNFTNDIAIIYIAGKIKFSDSVKPVCLATPSMTFRPQPKYICYATGWGHTGVVSEGGKAPSTSQKLMQVPLPLVDKKQCQTKMNDTDSDMRLDMMICAGEEQGGKDSCEGDSGGPLVCQDRDGHWYQFGVISVGVGCALEGRYGIYAKVENFNDFIENGNRLKKHDNPCVNETEK